MFPAAKGIVEGVYIPSVERKARELFRPSSMRINSAVKGKKRLLYVVIVPGSARSW
jgi:hypothetical protein